MTQWYILRGDTIINACMTSDPEGPNLALFQNPDGLRALRESEVPMRLLEQYQYWNERP